MNSSGCFWAVQHACHLPEVDAKHSWRIELDLLCHLSRRCHCFRAHGGGGPGMPVSGV